MNKMIEELRRPFKPADVNYKIQTSSPKGVMCVAYVDARHVSERLNDVTEGRWSHVYREVIVAEKIEAIECKLTLRIPYLDKDGDIFYHSESHCDVGSFDNVNRDAHGLKAVYSDALKRAAVHFGVAVALYSHPFCWINWDETDKLKLKNGKPVGLTVKGQAHLRAIYRKWLLDEGIKEFGQPYGVEAK